MYTRGTDFDKPGIYGGSVRVWTNAWDVFRRTASRSGPGRRDDVDLFRGVSFFLVLGGISYFYFDFSSSNAHVLLQV